MRTVSLHNARLLDFLLISRVSYAAPLDNVIEYEYYAFEDIPTRLVNGSMNPDKPTNFGGDPRPALDEAWSHLLRSKLGINLTCLEEPYLTNKMVDQDILLSEEDLGDTIIDETAARTTDGSGVFASLTVFHALHCIERFHHYLYFDEYYSTLTDREKLVLKYHTGKIIQLTLSVKSVCA
jgi:hypothetical protein